MVYQVKDLTPEQRHAAEVLLGHRVAEDEAVSIKAIEAGTIIPSKLSPQEAVAAFKALSERWASTERPEMSEAEEEEIAIEAQRSTRPNYRPVA